MSSFTAGQLNVSIYDSRKELGDAAGAAAAEAIRDIIAREGRANVVFACAPSQDATLGALTGAQDIDWRRVTAFHMDEYLGATPDAPHSFRRYLAEHLLGKVPVGRFYGIRAEAPDPEAFCRDYARLLTENPPDLCLMGIGENGHIAFNDPPVCDFNDALDVKIVELDLACREQQVADGAFPKLEDVPRRALTLTVPRLMRIPKLIVSVPGRRKQEAVRAAVNGPITTACPASILRTHADARMFLDRESAALL